MRMIQHIRPAIGKAVFFLFAGFLFFGTKGTAGAAQAAALPFSVGEIIRYRVSWEMVPAGDVTFKVMPHTDFKGEPAWHFVLEGRSRRYVDLFYKIRDRFDSFTDLEFNRSLEYRKLQTGKEDKNVVVAFDWDKNLATYSNHGGKRPSIEIPDNTFDPLSSFYKLRTLDFSKVRFSNGTAEKTEKGDLYFPVTDGKRCFIQKGQVLKKERISLVHKSYDTYLIIPHVNHFSGVFKKSENPSVKVWLSADERQIPVRIAIKVFIGSVIFELAEH